jgi:hypothetical protein
MLFNQQHYYKNLLCFNFLALYLYATHTTGMPQLKITRLFSKLFWSNRWEGKTQGLSTSHCRKILTKTLCFKKINFQQYYIYFLPNTLRFSVLHILP